MDVDAAKERLCAEVDARAEVLIDASHRIHEHPELCFEEQHAHDLLCDLLEAEGLPVERGAFELDTAFRADAGDDGPCIAVCCEYDALPGIGHGCGHNIIATAGLGAALAAAALADELGGRIRVLGTPAEEGGGGKVYMAERGAFEGADAAMMVHPADGDLTTMNAIAVAQLWVEYEGLAAHAAAFPERGRNALDAAVLGYMNVAALRQHIGTEERVHGIFPDGGDKPNIVPAHATSHWYVRSPNLDTLAALEDRVRACLQAGADAAGCTMTVESRVPVYADLLDNPPLIDLYRANAERLGRRVRDGREFKVVGSTDMGNVSHLLPSIHPMIKVSPGNVPIHTADFAGFAAGERGDKAVLDGAKAMAMTIADLWSDGGHLDAARAAFEATADPG